MHQAYCAKQIGPNYALEKIGASAGPWTLINVFFAVIDCKTMGKNQLKSTGGDS